MDRQRWLPGVERHLGSYVYLLVDPRDGRVFYVGKGEGQRCFAHVAEARTTTTDTKGDYAKLRTIREIEQGGRDVRIEVLRHGLSAEEAFMLESASIDLLGIEGLHNRVRGQHSRDLGRATVDGLNARYGAEPVTVDLADRVVMIRPRRLFHEGMTDEEVYRAAREWWVVGPPRRALGTPKAPDLVFAVHAGVVRAVYRITGWRQPSPAELEQRPSIAARWAFHGQLDAVAEERYLLRDVTMYLAKASQNPLLYVNC